VGGAPLDLIVDKVQAIQNLFYRTIELLFDQPHRRRGSPSREIQDLCRPWLFQAPPGSYQFSVAVQERRERDFFKEHISSEDVADKFLDILAATSDENLSTLAEIVPDDSYRSTFLKLSRNLAPTGKALDQVEFRRVGDSRRVALTPISRSTINTNLKQKKGQSPSSDTVAMKGTLRAVDLNKNWLDVTVDGETLHVIQLRDTVDDVIGPMVNRPVTITVKRTAKGKLLFEDIELDD